MIFHQQNQEKNKKKADGKDEQATTNDTKITFNFSKLKQFHVTNEHAYLSHAYTRFFLIEYDIVPKTESTVKRHINAKKK